MTSLEKALIALLGCAVGVLLMLLLSDVALWVSV